MQSTEKQFNETFLTEIFRGPEGQLCHSRLFAMGNGYFLRVYAAMPPLSRYVRSWIAAQPDGSSEARVFWSHVAAKTASGMIERCRAVGSPPTLCDFANIVETFKTLAAVRPHAQAMVRGPLELNGVTVDDLKELPVDYKAKVLPLLRRGCKPRKEMWLTLSA